MYLNTKKTLEEIYNTLAKEFASFEKEYFLQFQSDNIFLQPIFDYVGQEKGKRLRPILFFLSQGLIHRPNRRYVKIAVLIELLHTATLIHDDVVDGSLERRGKRSLNAVWGDRVSVLLGDYLLARVLSLAVEVERIGVLEIISRVVMEMGRGELRQTVEGMMQRVSVDDYFNIIREKTACLFGAACELGGIVMSASASEKNRLRQLGETFGMAFQIRDDILDFSGHTEFMGKPVGQDVTNGKMTLPLILALEGVSEEEKQGILQRLDSATEEDGEWIRKFVKRRKGIENAQEKAQVFLKRAIELLDTFKPSIYREMLERLVMHDTERVE